MADVNEGSAGPTDNSQSIYTAVVCEILYDLGVFPYDKRAELVETWNIKNKEKLFDAPLNSCIVRYFGAGATMDTTSFVVYPFFPPNLSMPVKPGECVWVMSPTLDKPAPDNSFWICKIPGNQNASSTNFTHFPRSFMSGSSTTISSLTTAEKASVLTDNPPVADNPEGVMKITPNFINDIKGNDVLAPYSGSLQNLNPFDLIAGGSKAIANFVLEPVPIYSKRVGDLVLQGSNNTLICLGQDRGWDYNSTNSIIAAATGSNAQNRADAQAGTIDIVTGRSRYFPPVPMSIEDDGDSFERTNQRTVQNSRGQTETLHDPLKSGLAKNPVGGDPDFVADASRIYVSMLTSADENFGLSAEVGRMAAGFEAAIENIDNAAYIVTKADEVRIVARKQDEKEWYSTAENPAVNGSVRIIKEGKSSEDLATICLLPDGTIQISGSKIFLGRAEADGGAGGGPGPGSSQPYVKYQDLEDLWNSTMDALDEFCTTVLTHTTPGYGAPSVQLNDAISTLKSEIAGSLKPDIVNVKSERIFGE